jgi:hypothetical protein
MKVDRREAVGAARRHRAWEPMQTGIDRQRTHPRRPRTQCPIPVTAHLAQDGELVLIHAGDGRSRADVGQFRSRGLAAVGAVGSRDSRHRTSPTQARGMPVALGQARS